MRYIILWIILLSFSPALAYGSGNTIYVKREHTKKPSLLDRKFIFREVQTTVAVEPRATNITAMHQQLTVKPKAQQKIKSVVVEKPSSNNWNDFATETEWADSKDVSAKLIY